MTDHIGDVTKMIPMTRQRLDEIKAQVKNADAGDTDYYELMRLVSCAIPALLQEVERLQAEVERFRAKRNETIDAIENLMESCRACDMCALDESDDTCSDNGEGYCSPVWIGRKEG